MDLDDDAPRMQPSSHRRVTLNENEGEGNDMRPNPFIREVSNRSYSIEEEKMNMRREERKEQDIREEREESP